jgi:hypothetical protein
MDVNVGKSFWETLKNQYKQQRRWGWGAEDIPYLLDRFPKKTGLPKKTKLYWLLHVFDDFHSWATSSIMIFALGWLPVWLGGRVFNDTLLSYNLPKITQYIVSLSTVGIATSAIVFMLLLPDPPKGFKKSGYLYYVLQWLLAPVTLIIFGAFPALDAQTRLMIGGKWRLGFWVTPKGRKKAAVEAKVQ